MKRLLILLLLTLCLPAAAMADWMDNGDWPDWVYEIEYPVVVTDRPLCQELEAFARAELARRFPKLTETQLAHFDMDDVYTYESRENWWSVSLHYHGIENVQMDFDVIRTAEGTFEIEHVLPWDIEELVALYDSAISHADALAAGRISLAAAMADYAAQYPDEAKAAVDYYGLAMLDPSGFLTHAWFQSPLNQGGADEPLRWSLNFMLPVDPEAGPDCEMNLLWYRVEINAVTGAVLHETIDSMFALPKDAK